MPPLATHFLRLFAAEMGLKAPPFSGDALDALQRHDYPGNVRELKNVIERALIESCGDVIRAEHLGLPTNVVVTPARAARTERKATAAALPLNLAEAEELLVQRALQKTGGNIADAARLLGVHRTRIYRKLAQEEAPPVT